MNFEKLVKSGYMERFVTDILYADLENNQKEFLKIAYEKYIIDSKDIWHMAKGKSKIGSKVENTIFEDIIEIIVRKICHGDNKGLYEDFMVYYLKEYPFVKKEFEDANNDVNKWLWLYSTAFGAREEFACDLKKRTFILLYCMTYGESEAVDKFMGMIDIDRWHYIRDDFRFYDMRNFSGSYYQKLEELKEYTQKQDIRLSSQFRDYKEVQMVFLAKHLGIRSSDLEEAIVDHMTREVPTLLMDVYDSHGSKNYPAISVLEGLNGILRKYGMRQLVLFKDRKNEYPRMFRELFERMCIEKLYMTCIDSKTRGDSLDLDGLYERGHDNIDAFARELMSRFWFECYLKGQERMQRECYDNFRTADSETDKEILEENKRLREELSQCKSELRRYAVAEERKRQKQREQRERKKEKIVSLSEKQEEQEKA